jgi:hypothetical protein
MTAEHPGQFSVEIMFDDPAQAKACSRRMIRRGVQRASSERRAGNDPLFSSPVKAAAGLGFGRTGHRQSLRVAPFSRFAAVVLFEPGIDRGRLRFLLGGAQAMRQICQDGETLDDRCVFEQRAIAGGQPLGHRLQLSLERGDLLLAEPVVLLFFAAASELGAEDFQPPLAQHLLAPRPGSHRRPPETRCGFQPGTPGVGARSASLMAHCNSSRLMALTDLTISTDESFGLR